MDPKNCRPKTMLIDWAGETFYYRLDEDQIVRYRFLPASHEGTDLFGFCCGIAIAQQQHARGGEAHQVERGR